MPDAPRSRSGAFGGPAPAPPSAPVLGWREWIALPGLGIPRIKAKVDTGARSSALHAWDIRRFRRRGVSMVRFRVHPLQRDLETTVAAEAEVLDRRAVRSSSGESVLRWVILTEIQVMDQRWPAEVTLSRRDAMGFRMLLGRQAIRGRFLVDPGASFLAPTLTDVPPPPPSRP